MKAIPTIEHFMTTVPKTIGADQTIDKAEAVMREHQIRHLPVLDGGTLIGILSDRDIKMIQGFSALHAEKIQVKEACTEKIFAVSPNAPLTEVCAEMAMHKYGSVLVLDNHKLVGIFTWVDALQAFQKLMETRLKVS